MMPIPEPIFVKKLLMEIKDKDLVNDESMGSFRFKIQDIKNGLFAKPFWAHVYGAPPDSGNFFNRGDKSDIAQQMNNFPQSGTRLLTSLELQRVGVHVDGDQKHAGSQVREIPDRGRHPRAERNRRIEREKRLHGHRRYRHRVRRGPRGPEGPLARGLLRGRLLPQERLGRRGSPARPWQTG